MFSFAASRRLTRFCLNVLEVVSLRCRVNIRNFWLVWTGAWGDFWGKSNWMPTVIRSVLSISVWQCMGVFGRFRAGIGGVSVICESRSVRVYRIFDKQLAKIGHLAQIFRPPLPE